MIATAHVLSIPVQGAARPIALLSGRDRDILERTSRKLRSGCDFGDALRALKESVEESILGGRVFFLGVTHGVPIFGSVISGIGIVDDPHGVRVVRARRNEPIVDIARLVR